MAPSGWERCCKTSHSIQDSPHKKQPCNPESQQHWGSETLCNKTSWLWQEHHKYFMKCIKLLKNWSHQNKIKPWLNVFILITEMELYKADLHGSLGKKDKSKKATKADQTLWRVCLYFFLFINKLSFTILVDVLLVCSKYVHIPCGKSVYNTP